MPNPLRPASSPNARNPCGTTDFRDRGQFARRSFACFRTKYNPVTGRRGEESLSPHLRRWSPAPAAVSPVMATSSTDLLSSPGYRLAVELRGGPHLAVLDTSCVFTGLKNQLDLGAP